MKHFSSSELRDIRNTFRLSKQHQHLPEVSLIADKDSTALFNVAGMQPLIPYLMGKEHPLGKRLFNVQKCVRTVDIAEVGDASHLTCFEMLGNRSLGDYFKKESVKWSREFLTGEKYLHIDPKKIAVTVFAGDENAPRDEETATYWKEIFAQAGLPMRISYLPARHNWRSPWPVGPCGPDTEIFYRVGEGFPPELSTVESDEENWMEIWNNVFMEYYRDESWLLSKLSKQNVDTGMGFERLCVVLQGKDSVYETDLFTDAMKVIQSYAMSADEMTALMQRRLRIVADHARTAFMLINDGLIPSNVGAGYVLRMIIRRMVYNMILIHEISLDKYADFIQRLLVAFQGLREFQEEEIIRVMMGEVSLFQKTIQAGKKILDEMLKAWKQKAELLIQGSDIFKLYDTYGFPLELTKEIADEQWFSVDEEGFHVAMEAAKEKSRLATKEMFKRGMDWSKYLEEIPQTEFIGYTDLSTDEPKLLKSIELEDGQQVLIFDKTPFYPEMGGQVGDFGVIGLENGEQKTVTQVQKFAGVILHFTTN